MMFYSQLFESIFASEYSVMLGLKVDFHLSDLLACQLVEVDTNLWIVDCFWAMSEV
jgi:hypothetical protein